MITMISVVVSLLSFRFRSRASLELELVAVRHQVTVLRRQRKGRIQLFSTDRLLWVWLYRIWPQALNAMVLVKPATVPDALRVAEKREREIYGVTDAKEIERVLKSYRDFVALCALKEQETGIPCLIIASF